MTTGKEIQNQIIKKKELLSNLEAQEEDLENKLIEAQEAIGDLKHDIGKLELLIEYYEMEKL